MRRIERSFLVLVLLTALLVIGSTIARLRQPGVPLDQVSASGGKPRVIDSERIRSLIRQQKLADQPARFYTPAVPERFQQEGDQEGRGVTRRADGLSYER